MSELCKTDKEKILRYLRDAEKLYSQSSSLKFWNRGRLIRKLIKKLEAKWKE